MPSRQLERVYIDDHYREYLKLEAIEAIHIKWRYLSLLKCLRRPQIRGTFPGGV